MRRTVYTARHGHRQDNADKEWGKSAKWLDDPELSEIGVSQAVELARKLKGVYVEHVFSSHFLRVLQTANTAAEVLDRKIKVENGFGEWMKREWFQSEPVLMPLTYKMSFYPRIDRTYRPFLRARVPETWEDVEVRIGAALRHVLETTQGDIIIFGHGGTIEGVHLALLGEKPAQNSKLCCLNRYVCRDGEWEQSESWAPSVYDSDGV